METSAHDTTALYRYPHLQHGCDATQKLSSTATMDNGGCKVIGVFSHAGVLYMLDSWGGQIYIYVCIYIYIYIYHKVQWNSGNCCPASCHTK